MEFLFSFIVSTIADFALDGIKIFGQEKAKSKIEKQILQLQSEAFLENIKTKFFIMP